APRASERRGTTRLPHGAAVRRSGAPQGACRRERGPPLAERVRPAALSRRACRQGRHPSATAARGLGTGAPPRRAIPSRRDPPAPSEARSRRLARTARHGVRCGLPAAVIVNSEARRNSPLFALEFPVARLFLRCFSVVPGDGLISLNEPSMPWLRYSAATSQRSLSARLMPAMACQVKHALRAARARR